MNKMKESLVAHKSEILAKLGNTYEADLDKEIADLPENDTPPLEGDAEIAAIKAELKANPFVDENAAGPELAEIKLPPPIVPATDEEIAAEKADLLSQAQAMAAKTAKNIDATKNIGEKAEEAVEAAEAAINKAIDKLTHPFG